MSRRLLAVLLALASPVAAHDGATGVVRERMDAFEAMDAEVDAVTAMVRGRAAWDADRVRTAGVRIEGLAVAVMALFPQGSGGPPSEALPIVWEDWTGFVAYGNQLIVRAGRVAERADDPEAGRDALIAMARTCAACHDDYRMER